MTILRYCYSFIGHRLLFRETFQTRFSVRTYWW